MSALPKPRRATWEDVLAAPAHMTAELIDGELSVLPRPAYKHNKIRGRIFRLLAADDPDGDDITGWVIVQETELHLGSPEPRSLVLVPDLSGWRTGRVDDIEDAVAVEVVPDWVCEILSPSNERYDRLVKMDTYASLGVAWAWLVDPAAELLEVYELRQGVSARVQAGGPEDELDVLPFGVRVKLGRWFRRTRVNG
jgi:Uma2 family endonuclease